MEDDHDTITTVSRKWFPARDTDGNEITDRADTELVLATTVAIDARSHKH